MMNILIKTVHLVMELPETLGIVEILQNGFLLECRVGVSLRSLLCGELALNPEYVSERISTIFLDGKCVDDIDSAIVKAGSALALSAAMPGLAGATLRKGGVYAAMRSSITHRENNRPGEEAGLCTVKLFNLLIRELGPILLRHGILVKPEEMESLLSKKPEEFQRRRHQILFEEESIGRDSLLECLRHSQVDFLRLTASTDI
jgi:hypothetical protein